MTAKERASAIYHTFYRILFDSDSDKGEEINVSILAKQCALAAADLVQDTHFVGEYWDEVKKEIELMP